MGGCHRMTGVEAFFGKSDCWALPLWPFLVALINSSAAAHCARLAVRLWRLTVWRLPTEVHLQVSGALNITVTWLRIVT